jgi:hypothetical protein
MWSANRRGARPSTARVPLARDLVVLLVAVVLYAGFLFAHPFVTGVAVWNAGG